jgi:hypothetical protein
MKLKFLGDLAKLKKCVSRTGVPGQWREIKNQQMQYRTDDGAFLNWWESSGTITFQAKEEETIRKLKRAFVKVATKKGLLRGVGDTEDEITDLSGVISEIGKLKRWRKRMQIEFAELRDAVPSI